MWLGIPDIPNIEVKLPGRIMGHCNVAIYAVYDSETFRTATNMYNGVVRWDGRHQIIRESFMPEISTNQQPFISSDYQKRYEEKVGLVGVFCPHSPVL